MVINKAILNALSSINIPKSFQVYKGNQDTYITYFAFNESGASWADNNEIAIEYMVQVDVFSKSDYTTLVDQVINCMKDAGFRRTSVTHLYESDLEIYHCAIRFSYIVEPK
jgi:hypothetical protein